LITQKIALDRKEKKSARTVRLKTLLAKAIKKGAAKPLKAFLEKEKRMRFAATRRWKMTIEGPTNKGQSSSVGLKSKGKLLPTDTQNFFRAISDC
jgi:intein/homing endonuclease